MISYFAVEYLNNVPQRVYLFPPEADPTASSYRAVLSAGAFDTAMCSGCLKDPNQRRFWLMRPQEWAIQLKVDERWRPRGIPPLVADLEQIKQDDLWTFYRTIGYDYKKKKFI